MRSKANAPITLMRQRYKRIRSDSFKKFGINEIIYGPVYHSVIDQILTTWIVNKGKGKSTQSSLRGTPVTSAEQGDSNSSVSFKTATQSEESSYARYHCNQDGRMLYISEVSGNFQSNGTSSSNPTLSRPINQKLPLNKSLPGYLSASKSCSASRPGTSSDGNEQPGTDAPSSDVNSNQASPWGHNQPPTSSYPPYSKGGGMGLSIPSFVAKETTEISSNSSTPSMCNAYPTPPPSLGSAPCRFPFVTPASFAAIPPHQNCTYVINGTPGTAGMRITYIPDELNKHSTKERERRERIKESCNQLRSILPRQAMNGRKADMATVLEMTVFYLRIIQTQIPPHIQQQVSQLFCTFQSKCKRKRGEAPDGGEPAPKNRLLDPPYYSSLAYPGETPPPPPSGNPPFLYPGPGPVACSSLPMPSAFSHLPTPNQGPAPSLAYLSQYGYPSALHSRPAPFLPPHQSMHPKPFATDHLGQSNGGQGMNLYVDVCHNTSKETNLANENGQESLSTTEPF